MSNQLTICNQCEQVFPKLLLCSRCRSRVYCSRECQIADIGVHRAHCKFIATLEPFIAPDITEFTDIACVTELLNIAVRCAVRSEEADTFDSKNTESESYRTARAIGERLHMLGGYLTMVYCFDSFKRALPNVAPGIEEWNQKTALDDLDQAWHGIGEWCY